MQPVSHPTSIPVNPTKESHNQITSCVLAIGNSVNTRKRPGGLRATPYRTGPIRMPITIQMSRSIVGAILTGLLTLTGLVSGADVRGTITIERKLTPRNVTPAAGLYQRGSPVALRSDTHENALDYERSHVVVYLEGDAGKRCTDYRGDGTAEPPVFARPGRDSRGFVGFLPQLRSHLSQCVLAVQAQEF